MMPSDDSPITPGYLSVAGRCASRMGSDPRAVSRRCRAGSVRGTERLAARTAGGAIAEDYRHRLEPTRSTGPHDRNDRRDRVSEHSGRSPGGRVHPAGSTDRQDHVSPDGSHAARARREALGGIPPEQGRPLHRVRSTGCVSQRVLLHAGAVRLPCSRPGCADATTGGEARATRGDHRQVGPAPSAARLGPRAHSVALPRHGRRPPTHLPELCSTTWRTGEVERPGHGRPHVEPAGPAVLVPRRASARCRGSGSRAPSRTRRPSPRYASRRRRCDVCACQSRFSISPVAQARRR